MRVRIDVRRMIASGWKTAPKVQGGKILAFMYLLGSLGSELDGVGAVFITCDDVGRGSVGDRTAYPGMLCVEVVDAADGERAWTMVKPEHLFGMGFSASRVAADLWRQAWDDNIHQDGSGYPLVSVLPWARYKPSWHSSVTDPSGFDI